MVATRKAHTDTTGVQAVMPFKSARRDLSRLGFHPIPLAAGGKAPCITDWTRFCDKPLTRDTYDPSSIRRDSNIGLAMGSPCGERIVIAIDIDVDEYETIDRLKRALPPVNMSKRGAKGETWFYLASPEVSSAQYRRDDGVVLVDLLARGRQTVVPPSVHPSGCIYKWLTDPVAVTDLPILDEDHWIEFHEALEACGWNGGTEAPRDVNPATGEVDPDNDSLVDDINAISLARLATWVPKLGLFKCRHKLDGFEAVATWRDSSAGRALEERERHLSISSKGIRDFGASRGYSPIGLVQAATGRTFSEAWLWLHDVTGLRAETDAIVVPFVERLLAESAARRLEKEARTAAASKQRSSDAPTPFTWDDREANAAQAADWLIKKLCLRVGVHLLWGQSGSGKSFVGLEIARCIAIGDPFFGHRVKASGGTLFALGEGGSSMPARLDALRIGKLGDSAPINPSTGELIDVDRLPLAWMPVSSLSQAPEFRAFSAKVRLAAEEMPLRHGCPLRLVIIDTVVASFGFAEDPDASKVTDAMKKLDALAQELGICIIAIHHAGKSKEAGEHGSYAWRGSVETSIGIDAMRNDIGAVSSRQLFVTKTRHGGNEGWNCKFDLKTIPLGIDEDGDPIESAVVEPFEPGIRSILRNSAPSMPVGVKRIVAALGAALTASSEPIEFDDGFSTNAVPLDCLSAEYTMLNPPMGRPETGERMFRRDLHDAGKGGFVADVDVEGVRMFFFPEHANDNAEDAT